MHLQAHAVGIHLSGKGLLAVQVQGEAAQLGVPGEPGQNGVRRKQLCLLLLEIHLKHNNRHGPNGDSGCGAQTRRCSNEYPHLQHSLGMVTGVGGWVKELSQPIQTLSIWQSPMANLKHHCKAAA